jgi:Methylenetetrahydrofolate reductase
MLQGLDAVAGDDERVKAFGVKEAVGACRKLIEAAAPTSERSIHLYTMNLAQVSQPECMIVICILYSSQCNVAVQVLLSAQFSSAGHAQSCPGDVTLLWCHEFGCDTQYTMFLLMLVAVSSVL